MSIRQYSRINFVGLPDNARGGLEVGGGATLERPHPPQEGEEGALRSQD